MRTRKKKSNFEAFIDIANIQIPKFINDIDEGESNLFKSFLSFSSMKKIARTRPKRWHHLLNYSHSNLPVHIFTFAIIHISCLRQSSTGNRLIVKRSYSFSLCVCSSSPPSHFRRLESTLILTFIGSQSFVWFPVVLQNQLNELQIEMTLSKDKSLYINFQYTFWQNALFSFGVAHWIWDQCGFCVT